MNNTLWVEKYRPTKIEDCILPDEIKTMFQSIVDSGEIPNLLLTGSPGIGKTTVAKALCNQLDCDWLMKNGRDEGRMIVQPALRGVIEEFSKNCRFIFTCNFKNRIIPALHSRCSVVDFKISKDAKPALGMEMLENVKRILNEESVKYEESVLVQLVLKYFPDFRRVINELQKYSLNGIIDEDILKQSSDENFNELFVALKEKNFSDMRKWVAQNIDNDHVRLYRQIYDTLNNRFEKKSIPQAVLTIADYSYKSAFVADQEVNMVACLTEMMMDCEFI